MSKTMFENSKVALAFAGVTLVGAAIFASTVRDDGSSSLVPDRPEQRERLSEAPRVAAAKQDSTFSDYVSDEELGFNDFADDGELIDSTQGADTSGFSTASGDTSEIIVPPYSPERSTSRFRDDDDDDEPVRRASSRPSTRAQAEPRVQPRIPNDDDAY